ncbi:hypothetical protein [Pseudacidovorax sp. NFM-22]|uniref:hypothetical protein n=1 Tax=Pseudacidovorax sp. NFM-22 TaxID=2744469 RepID=UPI001F1EBED5|nr:hypothetical protein [Pseudacidovorax sp. NFM-22]
MLHTLGLRIERLLYFGFVLLLICALEVYFTAAAAYFNATETRALDSLIEIFEKDRDQLKGLYDESRKPYRPSTDRENKVAEMRASLGLPAKKGGPPGDGPTYKSKVESLLNSSPGAWQIQGQIGSSLDLEKNPDQILDALKNLKNLSNRERGTVLGIETPRLLTLQYGSADFRISAQFLAGGLLVALYPLSLVWLGSFYITRQRELLGIRATRDLKDVFPHILNILAVDFSGLRRRLGLSVKPRDALINLGIARIASISLRSLFIIIAVFPYLLH